MILYELTCTQEHGFEAWFASSDAFEQQQKGHQIACPVCEDHRIEKAPMAPRIGKRSHEAKVSAPQAPTPQASGEAVKMVSEFCRTIESNCDYVGLKFPEEARKIHYGETSARGIYGEASKEDAVALKEEGIEVAAIPWVKKPDA